MHVDPSVLPFQGPSVSTYSVCLFGWNCKVIAGDIDSKRIPLNKLEAERAEGAGGGNTIHIEENIFF